ncbi:hypothetical protein Q7C36_011589 [Tachysurus vachellii]|uniref:Uncharacterized protein n=1 Tax=Tachysurus vachellii TaxID=175792 RepID=A0AA88MS02_TACVA|nr:hypothetical protein Q7C36_011589 [Tachysurus vachellii]
MERRLSDSRAGRGSPHRAFGSETNVAGYFLTRKTPQPIREEPRWSTFESPNMLPRVPSVEQLKMELNEMLYGLRKSVMEDRRVMEQNGERDHAHWLSVELTLLHKFKGTGAQKAGFVQAYFVNPWI